MDSSALSIFVDFAIGDSAHDREVQTWTNEIAEGRELI